MKSTSNKADARSATRSESVSAAAKAVPAGSGATWRWVVVLAVLTAVLFRAAFRPGYVAFSNDGPMGAVMAQIDSPWDFASGFWQHLNWAGYQQLGASPNLTQALFTLVGPRLFGAEGVVMFAKLYPAAAMFFTGLCAFWLMRRFGFRPWVAGMVGIGTAFNSNLLSYACWGLPVKALTAASILVAIGLIHDRETGWRRWGKVVLAGAATGMAVMEGADVGAIFSLYVAAYAMFRAWDVLQSDTPGTSSSGVGVSLLRGGVHTAIIAVVAAIVATHALSALIGTQIQGISGMAQDSASREARWDAATFGSYPIDETVRLLIPGVYGYRMDSDGGKAYWGSVGGGGGMARFSGSGEYIGLAFFLFGIWAVIRAIPKEKGSPYSPSERRHVFFWAAVVVISLLLAYGRNAPFYRIVYSLPYFSTIRLPMKFLHVSAIGFLVLAGYGMEGFARQYMDQGRGALKSLGELVGNWWRQLSSAERVWAHFMIGFAGLSVVGAIIYSAAAPSVLSALEKAPTQVGTPAEVFAASRLEVWIYLGFLLAYLGWMLLGAAGFWGSGRVAMAVWILGALLAVDLIRANSPWIIYYDQRHRYQTNPVFDFLRQNGQLARSTAYINPTRQGPLILPPRTPQEEQMVSQWPYIHKLWLENHFQYYQIPALDLSQMPRMHIMEQKYLMNFAPTNNATIERVVREWELTATKYLFASRGYEGQLNQFFDPAKRRFRSLFSFAIAAKTGAPPDLGRTFEERMDNLTAVTNSTGPLSVIEFTGALPRARWYGQWEVVADEDAALLRLRESSFDPASRVILDAAPQGIQPNPAATGEVRVVDYKPKRVQLESKSDAAGVVLFNDRWHDDWKATVDGQPATVMRANFLMRGIAVPAGTHRIEFRFQPAAGELYVTLAALVGCLGLSVALLISGRSAKNG